MDRNSRKEKMSKLQNSQKIMYFIWERPFAKSYVHCAANNLSLALNNVIKGVPEVASCFHSIDCVFHFCNASVEVWTPMRTFLLEHSTRWTSRDKAMSALRFGYKHILKIQTEVSLKFKKRRWKSYSNRIKTSKFYFNFSGGNFFFKLSFLNPLSRCQNQLTGRMLKRI